MAYDRNKVIDIAKAELGYLEKKSGDCVYLYEKTDNAGDKNYTKYGKEMHEIYPSVMDYPAAWCDCFVDWCFMQAYGIANAKSLLGGDFDDYTVASALLYKKKNAWKEAGAVPEAGWQIFFTNGKRICHTGIVIAYDEEMKRVVTIEGNTSSETGVVANGGCVRQKTYAVDYSMIAGYGVPAYDDGDFAFTPHWVNDSGKWYYRVADGENAHGWQAVNHHWYYFGEKGLMLTGWQEIDGQWFYLEESGGYEGACWHENDRRNGSLERWHID